MFCPDFARSHDRDLTNIILNLTFGHTLAGDFLTNLKHIHSGHLLCPNFTEPACFAWVSSDNSFST